MLRGAFPKRFQLCFFGKDDRVLVPPPSAPYELPSCHPRTLIPLETPPQPTILPALPSSPRTSLLDVSFVLTTHLVPAAFPRTTPDVPLPPLPTWSADKNQFKESVARTMQGVLTMKENQWKGELAGEGSRKPLWICLNRYVKRGALSLNGVTLLFTHANGFPKEIWEPTLLHLAASDRPQYDINEIWVWEAVNHGDSYLVNAQNLCGLYDWRDNTRDILHFLLHYLPSSPSPSPSRHTSPASPTQPPPPASRVGSMSARSSASDTLSAVAACKHRRSSRSHRRSHDHARPHRTLAAITHPALFSSLVLVDPMILPYPGCAPSTQDNTRAYVVGAIQRRDGWASRKDALDMFHAIPFFAAWHPAVLKIYVECGLRDVPGDSGVKLKMPGIQEAVVFAENWTVFETWELLSTLDPRVELRLSEVKQQLAWRRPKNCSNVQIASAGHLIAQEAPDKLARDIHEFLQRKYGCRGARL
ncbi:Peroxisomal membrane protein LPX1 [Grifola frondosa]|uniref:Peroxisomal membrane protein LPX1 n=1 Tax=Grifola frondosa TaxID=5627 RepID=A0A1C7MH41_GRIFR|nr:Peroxisomal membrane protein LPX1 [Grifola frondosa]